MSGAALVVGERGGYPPGRAGDGKNAGCNGSSFAIFSRRGNSGCGVVVHGAGVVRVVVGAAGGWDPSRCRGVVEGGVGRCAAFITSIGITRFRILTRLFQKASLNFESVVITCRSLDPLFSQAGGVKNSLKLNVY